MGVLSNSKVEDSVISWDWIGWWSVDAQGLWGGFQKSQWDRWQQSKQNPKYQVVQLKQNSGRHDLWSFLSHGKQACEMGSEDYSVGVEFAPTHSFIQQILLNIYFV